MPVVIQQLLPHPWPLRLHLVWTQHPQHPQWHPATHLMALDIHVKPKTKPKSGSSTFPKPPHSWTTITSGKRPKFCHNTQLPPTEAYITAVEEASSKLPSMEADELRSDVSHLLRQHDI